MNMSRSQLITVALLIVGFALAAPLVAGEREILDMPLGDPDRRDRSVAVVLDGITDAAMGNLISPATLADRLADTSILLIGESHTNIDFHNVQARVIAALHEAGREVHIGLEMFPYTAQKNLDDWIDNKPAETDWVQSSDWYTNWGYRWAYYREIFVHAQQNGIRMHAVNVPREVVSSVRRNGFDGLTEEQAAHVPTVVDTESSEYRDLFRAYFDEDDSLHMAISDAQWEGMFSAQCTWDATMGWNSAKALEEHGGDNAIMVVLIGSGHVTYGLGVKRQLANFYPGKVSTLVPVPVEADDQPIVSARATYADYIWGIPGATPPLYPVLGVSLMGKIGSEPTKIIQLEDEGVAARAGFRVGDVLLSIDGQSLDARHSLRQLSADFHWGDVVSVEYRRGSQTRTAQVALRRLPEEF
jgi:uncharacterized iron-regulated protein